MRTTKQFKTALSIVSVCFLVGCASIISSGKQTVTIASDPEDAVIHIDGIQVGKTPSTFPIERSRIQKTLSVSKDGYESQTVPLQSSINPVFFGNIVSGGLYGSTTDAISGAAYEYRPGYFFVLLKPANGEAPSNTGQIKMYTIQNYANLLKELRLKPNPRVKNKIGPTTEGLLNVLKIPEGERDSVVKQLKIFSENNKTALEFSIKVATLENK